MTKEQWTAVDRYITDLLVPSDPALEAALKTSAAAGLPAINVTPNLGKFLHLLARFQGVRRFNEVLAAEPRVSATEIQTVGSKGYDGFAIILVTADP